MNARIARTRLRVLGTGAALPGSPVSTDELLRRIERFGVPTRLASALARRVGVRTRHISRDFTMRAESPRPGARNPELAAAAVAQALQQAGCRSADAQYLLAHTSTPAQLLPAGAAEVARLLGYAGPCAELRQACTGFANALQWAAAMLGVRDAAPVAIVGSETGSVYFDPLAPHVDPGQWVNLVEMGDGAGAIVLGPHDGAAGASIEVTFFGRIASAQPPGLQLADGGSDRPWTAPGRATALFEHDYAAVRAHGATLFRAGLEAARAAGADPAAMRWWLPHQANGRIGQWLAHELGEPPQRFFVNADRVGNLGSASIWVALHELRSSGRLEKGDRVLVLGAEATAWLYGGFVYVHG